MPEAFLHLHGDLLALRRRRSPGPAAPVPVPSPRSVKDAVESLGVPHTEVGAVEVDGVEVGWDARLRGGEQVHVHPVDTRAGQVTPPPPARPTRFVADVHLGTLARRLRVLGLDTWWADDADDPELAELAAREGRVLLTRDRGLLMRAVVTHGALVRADDPDDQLVEVAGRWLRPDDLAPGTRCPTCNGPVDRVAATEVADRLEPGTRAAGHDEVGGGLRPAVLVGGALDGILALARGAMGTAREAVREDGSSSTSASSCPRRMPMTVRPRPTTTATTPPTHTRASS